MQVARAKAEPGAEETIPAGVTFTLESGDSALYASNLSGNVRNVGSEDLSLLIMEVAPSEMESDEEMMTLLDGVASTLLAPGESPDMSDGPMLLWTGRFVLEPEAGMRGRARDGAEIAYGEIGSFKVNPAEGPGLVVIKQIGSTVDAGQEPGVEPAALGATITFTAVDAVYFLAGNALVTSNLGTESANTTFGGIAVVPDSA